MRYLTPDRPFMLLPLLAVLFLVACGLTPASGESTPVAGNTPTPVVGTTPTPSASGVRQCTYTYSGGTNPALVAKVRAMLASADLFPLDVAVREIGEIENCNDGSSRLLVQSRHFSVTFTATDLTDRKALEKPLALAMGTLNNLAQTHTDRVSVSFLAGTARLDCGNRIVSDCAPIVPAGSATATAADAPLIALSDALIGIGSGRNLGIAGSGFAPGEEVVLWIADREVARVQVDGTGTFAKTIAVPCFDFCSSGKSTYVVATGVSSGKEARQFFSIVLVPPPPPAASPSPTPTR